VLEFRCGWVGLVSVLQAEALLTTYVLNMFRTLIYPSPGASDYSVELPRWSYCSWLDTPKLQHTSNQEQYDQRGNSTE